MTQREPAAANFDPVARPYRWMEYATFGCALERCRNNFLPQIAGCRRALVLGDGDGRFLLRLLGVSPELQADVVDSSSAMLRLLEKRAGEAGLRVITHHSDVRSFVPQRGYDLVVSHFFLDCFTGVEVADLCARIVPHMEPRALWVVSEFHIPEGTMHWPARGIVRLLYLAFRVLTGLRTTRLPDYQTAFRASGLTLIAERKSLGGLLTCELWQPEEYTPAMQLPPQRPRTPQPPDPVPDPEPASPSLPEPDPGVFHHEPDFPTQDEGTACNLPDK
jgi:ubiquinone/menaquinone biosynthesis C-methylase UbiE